MKTIPKRKTKRISPLLNAEIKATLERNDPQKWLARWRKKHVGVFDTGLLCNCGKENIKDHAEEKWPAKRLWGAPLSGPIAEALRKHDSAEVQEVRATHGYWCDECGATYRNEVVEGKREYVPREKREEPKLPNTPNG